MSILVFEAFCDCEPAGIRRIEVLQAGQKGSVEGRVGLVQKEALGNLVRKIG
jgi:hypothetical protein